MKNSFNVLSLDADTKKEEGAAITEVKKGKKKAGKKSNNAEVAEEEVKKPLDPIKSIIVTAVAQGFTEAKVNEVVAAMFDAGEAYHDVNAVIKKLKGGDSPKKPAAPAPVPVAHVEEKKEIKEKKDMKLKEVKTASPATPPTSNLSPIREDSSDSMLVRLEKAASMSHSPYDVVKAFCKWLGTVTREEKVAFFNSKAMSTFFLNIISSKPTPDIDADMGIFISHIPGITPVNKNKILDLIRISINSVGYLTLSNEELASRLVLISQMFMKDLSRESPLERQMREISTQIRNIKKAVVKSPSNSDIANQFRLRDSSHEAVKLSWMLVSAVTSSNSTAATVENVDESMLSNINVPFEGEHEVREQEVEFRSKVEALKENKSLSIAELSVKEKKLTEELVDLEREREALFKKVAEIEGKMKNINGSLSKINDQKREVHTNFHDSVGVIASQHQELAETIKTSDIRKTLYEAVKACLETGNQAYKSHYLGNNEKHLSELEDLKWRYLNEVKIYLDSEEKCVGFLKKRIETSKKEHAKLSSQLKDLSAIGVSLTTLAADLSSKISNLHEGIKEDEVALSHFYTSINGVLGVVNGLTQDPTFAASSKDKVDLIKQIQSLFHRLEIESDKIPTLIGHSRPVFEAIKPPSANIPLKAPIQKPSKGTEPVGAAPAKKGAFSWGVKTTTPAPSSLAQLMKEESGKK